MAVISGTKFDDQNPPIFDIIGNDQIFGLDGNDYINMVNGGNDEVHGDGGFDIVFYEAYSSGVTINFVTNLVTDGLGNTDKLFDLEAAHGSFFDDVATLGAGTSYVMTRAGNDTINFSSAKNGGSGRGGSGNDTYNGGTGFDLADFDDDKFDGAGDIKQGAVINLATGTATDGWGNIDKLNSIEGATGTRLADNITLQNFGGFTSARAGADIINFGAGGGGNATGGSGNDTFNGGVGFDAVSYFDDGHDSAGKTTKGVNVNLATGVAIDAWGNTDKLVSIEFVDGTNFADVFTLLNEGGFVQGGAGADIINYGSKGSNSRGGSGNDTYNGSTGFDFVDYFDNGFDAAGKATKGAIVNLATGIAIDSWGHTDKLNSIEGVEGSQFGDTITLNTKSDFAQGRGGSDVINYGSDGGSSRGGSGNDTFNGGIGFDYVDYNDDGFDQAGPITKGINVNLAAGTGTDGWGNTDKLNSIEGIFGTQFNDTIVGTNKGNELNGGDGDDTINGNGMQLGHWDAVSGGMGNDTITVFGEAYVNGDEGNDRIIGGTSGNVDIDYIEIFYYANAIIANLTAITRDGLAGGSNANGFRIADGQGGIDLVSGVHALNDSDFDDRIYVDNTYSNSYGNEFEVQLTRGDDRVEFVSVDFPTVSYHLAGGSVHVDLVTGKARDLIAGNTFIGNDTIIGLTGRVRGSLFDDELYGNDKGNQLRGNGGNDLLRGREGDDQLYGDNRNARTNDGNDKTFGDGGNDTLIDFGGNDLLDGGTGADKMSGGTGNDTYVVDIAGDTVTEFDKEGTDTVNSAITFSLAGQFLENLTLTGVANINGTGNSFDNIIAGNAGNNAINGGFGADKMSGGLGNDTFTVDNAGDKATEADKAGTDLVNSSVSYSLSGTFVELLTLTGAANINGTGNSLANIINGNAGHNLIDGGGGADKMTGGGGNDTYIVDNAGDTAIEANVTGSVDTVNSSVTYSLAGQFIEALSLTGAANINATGNSLANTLTGNSGNNLVDGSTGADTMSGGLGNDTFTIDNAGDKALEANNAGTDTANSSVTYSLAGQFIEVLNLTGAGNINGVGNSLANVMTGNSGNNVLDGATGADKMAGGLGNDTYIVDNSSDTITEANGAGTDVVNSTASFSLAGQFIETLNLLGSGNINGTGNTGSNTITGTTGSNILNGGLGTDILTGNAGNDFFRFDTALGASNVDEITDFAVNADKIQLKSTIFAALAGTVDVDELVMNANPTATLGTHRLLYDTDDGLLYYDADANGAGTAVLFARLDPGLLLDNLDFQIV